MKFFIKKAKLVLLIGSLMNLLFLIFKLINHHPIDNCFFSFSVIEILLLIFYTNMELYIRLNNQEKKTHRSLTTLLAKSEQISNRLEQVSNRLEQVSNKSLGQLSTSLKKINETNEELFVKQKNHIVHQFKVNSNQIYDRIDALSSIHNLIDLNAPLPIMHSWRANSDYVHDALTDIIQKGKGSVIDIGSGVSTLVFAYGLKKNGTGKVYSLEHSEKYYHETLRMIKTHKLEDYCEIHLCPLKEYTIDGKTWLWYDISRIDFNKDEIALISVDGPPGNTQEHARFPAVPLLKDHITELTTVFLDDAHRQEEKDIAKIWAENYKFEKNLVNLTKGLLKLNRL